LDPGARNVCRYSTVLGGDINTADGLRVYSGSPTIGNCVFLDNHSRDGGTDDGGAVYIGPDVQGTLVNCTFIGNTVAEEGGGLANYSLDTVVTSGILWGNRDGSGEGESAQIAGSAGQFSYCCARAWTGALGGEGNFSENPLLDGAVEDADRYYLSIDSPCIDTGDPDFQAGDMETDIDGEERIQGGLVEVGADELFEFPVPLFRRGDASDAAAVKIADPSR